MTNQRSVLPESNPLRGVEDVGDPQPGEVLQVAGRGPAHHGPGVTTIAWFPHLLAPHQNAREHLVSDIADTAGARHRRHQHQLLAHGDCSGDCLQDN